MIRKQRFFFGTNTKMYKGIAETRDFVVALDRLNADISRDHVQLFVIPSYTTIQTARQAVPVESMLIGAQNMGWADEGQFTGEISPVMLQEVGADLVMVGHSERRHVLGETDIEENKKILKGLQHNFVMLLCVGETGEEKELNLSQEAVRSQLKRGLAGVQPEDMAKVWIAYEPVWAIGVGSTPASKEYAETMHQVIKQALVEQYGEMVGLAVPVLYGGSVNPENAVGLASQDSVDGLFIGRSAWDAKRFHGIIRDVLAVLEFVD